MKRLTDSAGVIVNGREYQPPQQPTVVFTIDGGAPEYIMDALDRKIMPSLAAMLNSGGRYAVGSAEMPSLTNPNNVSIVTGVSPAVHGIAGNYCRTETGTEVLLNDPALIRASTIHSHMWKIGIPTLMVTAKDKLRGLLGAGGVPSISAEKAREMSLPDFDIGSVSRLVGEPVPDIYDPTCSHYAMKIGLAVHRACGELGLLYVSLTDRVQHSAPPRSPQSDAFHRNFDALLGQYLDAGFRVGITADHGMNPKHEPDGSARVVFLDDALKRAGIQDAEVVLPITDPYVRHHGALGSFAWIYLPDDQRETARAVLAGLDGIEEVYTKEESVAIYQHPADRVGDLSVAADARTALGKSLQYHDLSALDGPLRSHGGRHEQPVPLITSEPLHGHWDTVHRAGAARNRDLHDLVLNGIRS